MITLDNLTASYRHHPALHHVSAQLARGSLTAVAGPNGAGKSTVLKSIMGLLPLSGGRITVAAPRERIAYLPQLTKFDRSFPIHVSDCVALGCWPVQGAWGGIGAMALERVATALRAVGLEGFGRRSIGCCRAGSCSACCLRACWCKTPR